MFLPNSQQLQQDEFPEEEIDDRTMELARYKMKFIDYLFHLLLLFKKSLAEKCVS